MGNLIIGDLILKKVREGVYLLEVEPPKPKRRRNPPKRLMKSIADIKKDLAKLKQKRVKKRKR